MISDDLDETTFGKTVLDGNATYEVGHPVHEPCSNGPAGGQNLRLGGVTPRDSRLNPIISDSVRGHRSPDDRHPSYRMRFSSMVFFVRVSFC